MQNGRFPPWLQSNHPQNNKKSPEAERSQGFFFSGTGEFLPKWGDANQQPSTWRLQNGQKML